MRDTELLLEEFREDLVEFAIRLRSGLEVSRGRKGSSQYTIEDPKSGTYATITKRPEGNGRTRKVDIFTPEVPHGVPTSKRGSRVLRTLAKHFRDSARKGRPKEIYAKVVNPKLMHKLRKALPREIDRTSFGRVGRFQARIQKKLGRLPTAEEKLRMWASFGKGATDPRERRIRRLREARRRIIEAKARQKRG